MRPQTVSNTVCVPEGKRCFWVVLAFAHAAHLKPFSAPSESDLTLLDLLVSPHVIQPRHPCWESSSVHATLLSLSKLVFLKSMFNVTRDPVGKGPRERAFVRVSGGNSFLPLIVKGEVSI